MVGVFPKLSSSTEDASGCNTVTCLQMTSVKAAEVSGRRSCFRSGIRRTWVHVGEVVNVVCREAFASLHGIGVKRIRRIAVLKAEARSPKDMRGQHQRRGNVKPDEIIETSVWQEGVYDCWWQFLFLKDRKKSWIVEEKVFCLATNRSSRRIDIIAYSQTTKKGYIIDPTIRIETGSSQPEDVNKEKMNIYLPTVDYFKAKYQLEDIEVIGPLIGARGVIPKFFESFRKTFELLQTLTADIITSVLKRFCQILRQTGRSFQTRYKEHITAITKLQNTSTYAEHITNANHTYRDINTDMEILHIQPKSQKLNTLEQYEIYRHTKTHPNDILNTQLNFKTHTIFDSTLRTHRTHPHRKQEAPRPTTTSSEDDRK
ncbi:hypothetical protein ANN_22085 [Periplaneta americana]|uniref:Uncharacterized protein n=1 Tax=Periplaneta americana TaxID=6978 RepID=A0ABQ8S767_PERAM|nr:hypothetical protein ANN_22085 [Periplaneta americana]